MRLFITLLYISLSFIAVTADAKDNEKPYLWELTVDNTISTKGIERRANIVIPNHIEVASLAKNSHLTLPLPDSNIAIKIKQLIASDSQEQWSFEVISEPFLPEGKLFVTDGQISAWIPTSDGSWRVTKGKLVKEVKWASNEVDYKLSQHQLTNETESTKPGTEPDSPSITSENSSAPSNIRVLFVVTPEFAQDLNDTQNAILQAISVNNSIFQASGVNLNIEMAGMLFADFEVFSADQILDNLARSSLSDSTNGEISEELLKPIWEERFAANADIISVLTHSRPDGLCGKSWLNGTSEKTFDYRFAVNVVSANTEFESGTVQQCSLDTLGHEIGHNMGLGHSLAQGGEGTVFPYGRGYGVENEFATVMAYPQAFGDAAAVPLFSSPDLICPNDYNCGVGAEFENGADAVTALNEVRAEVTRLHNESVTMPIEDALQDLDEGLQNCVVEKNGFMVANEELKTINCPTEDVASLAGVNNFPRLTFISVNRSDDVSLEPLRYLAEVKALDFRFTRIEDLNPIVHLHQQLDFIQFFADNMSCQDVMVVESWEIGRTLIHGECFTREDDQEDFDSDGLSNLIDIDDDNDGLDDLIDALPFDASNADDMDADGVVDTEDAFPYDAEEFEDSDQDTLGNNRDEDDDNDGIVDELDCAPLDADFALSCDLIGDTGENCQPDCVADKKFVPYDYDGDGRADVAVRRASNATQYILNSSNAEIQRIVLGRNIDDVSVSGDFDGDKIADLAVRRPGNQFWYIKPSSELPDSVWRIEFGLQEQDVPVPADYDGDGITDIAVRRPSTFQWFVRRSSDGEIGRFTFGRQSDDIPVPADYDGDGKADIAVRRPSNKTWYILNSSNEEISRIGFGLQETDIPVPADYDGDGITDFAVRRPSNSTWYILQSSDQQIISIRFGLQDQDIPIVADYDGDGKTDVAVRRVSNHTQYILRSSDLEIERIQFGFNEHDMPLAAPVSVRFSNDVNLSMNPTEEKGNQESTQSEFLGIEILSVAEAAKINVYQP